MKGLETKQWLRRYNRVGVGLTGTDVQRPPRRAAQLLWPRERLCLFHPFHFSERRAGEGSIRGIHLSLALLYFCAKDGSGDQKPLLINKCW